MLQDVITHPNGTQERAVVIASTNGQLRGVLGSPADSAAGKRPSVLCLHGWGGGRCGPHDMLANLARTLNNAGYVTLRFDFADRGESDALPDGTNLDQMGEDALAAATFLSQESETESLVILGMCSGGNVGIGILDRLPHCCGMFLISVYPFSDGDSFGRQSKRTANAAKGYFRKALQPHTWKRLVRGAIDFKSIFAVLFGHYKRAAAQTTDAEREGKSPIDNLKTRRIAVHMVYGDADPDADASRRHFQTFAENHHLPITFETVAAADHNFYSSAHTENLGTAAVSFVAKQS